MKSNALFTRKFENKRKPLKIEFVLKINIDVRLLVSRKFIDFNKVTDPYLALKINGKEHSKQTQFYKPYDFYLTFPDSFQTVSSSLIVHEACVYEQLERIRSITLSSNLHYNNLNELSQGSTQEEFLLELDLFEDSYWNNCSQFCSRGIYVEEAEEIVLEMKKFQIPNNSLFQIFKYNSSQPSGLNFTCIYSTFHHFKFTESILTQEKEFFTSPIFGDRVVIQYKTFYLNEVDGQLNQPSMQLFKVIATRKVTKKIHM